MFKFTKTGLFVLSIVIMFFIAQIFIHKYPIETEINENMMEYDVIQEIPVVETVDKAEIWQIEIPRISLVANITEGTTKEILNQHVGHFKNTSKQQGNIGIASNCKDLKLLKQGDEIKYKYNDFEKTYEIEKNRIIKDTEWEFLEETEENMLTLITYVENQPEYRRCIQAEEKEYEVEVSEFSSDVFPTDINRVLVNCFYKQKEFVENIDKIFHSALIQLLNGTASDRYTALLYFDTYFRNLNVNCSLQPGISVFSFPPLLIHLFTTPLS